MACASAAAIPREQLVDVRLEPAEEGRIADEAVLDDFREAGAQLAVGQRAQRVGIRDTALGWWNAPMRFLPPGWLTPVLPPTEESTCASSVVGTCT